MHKLSYKTSMIGAFALMLTIAGAMTPSTYATVTPPTDTMITVGNIQAVMPYDVPTMTISTELINLIAA